MDAGQHHFPVAALRQPFHFPADVLVTSAAHPSSGIGNDAVGTELVAAVLDFNVGTGMLRRVL